MRKVGSFAIYTILGILAAVGLFYLVVLIRVQKKHLVTSSMQLQYSS